MRMNDMPNAHLSKRNMISAAILTTLLMACDPSDPPDSEACPSIAAKCAPWLYSLVLYDGRWLHLRDETGRIDSTSFSIKFRLSQTQATALTKVSKTTLDCAGCEEYFRPDSIYFTTEIVTADQDTLPAGYNFSTQPIPEGILELDDQLVVNAVRGFRDSVFQVHFIGKINEVRKSASATLHIQNPALLLP